MKNEENSKQLSLDLYSIRGIAIFLVVVGHVIGNSPDTGILQIVKFGVPLLQEISKFIYTFHVALFFIASGIAYAGFGGIEAKWPKFLRSRFQRLVVPLICWAPLIVVFSALSKGEAPSTSEMLQAIFSPHLIFWFFHALLFTSVLAALFLKKIPSKMGYLLFSGLLYSLFGTLNLFLPSPLLTVMAKFFLYWNLFYAIGIASSDFLLANRLQLKSIYAFFIIVICSIWMLLTNSFLPSESLWLARLLNAVPAFIALYLGLRAIQIPLFHRISEYLGRKSMVIYLFHIYFGTCTRILLSKVGIIGPLPQLIFGCTIALIGPMLLCETIFSRFPFFAFLIGENIAERKQSNRQSVPLSR
jgi:fucose 4-O-acetylase-like acetyltransferase